MLLHMSMWLLHCSYYAMLQHVWHALQDRGVHEHLFLSQSRLFWYNVHTGHTQAIEYSMLRVTRMVRIADYPRSFYFVIRPGQGHSFDL